jgi:PadR family transcriptional regulator PadR
MNSLSCFARYLAMHDTLRYINSIQGGPQVPESIEIQLKKGVLAMCVLALLARADSYAYEISSRLAHDIDMGEGTIYPLMRRLQSEGLVETYLVESTAGPSRKYYRLTDAGRQSLSTQTTDWEAFVRAVDGILAANGNTGTTSDTPANKGAAR